MTAMTTVDGLEPHIDEIVDAVHRAYGSLGHRPPQGQHTILAAFVLWNESTPAFKIISLATGLKCLPTARLPLAGDALHDSHAEVLARRGAVRWFLEELGRGGRSAWITARSFSPAAAQGSTFSLREGVRVILYVSTIPCGDASTRYLAAFQDEQMAALKDAEARPALPQPATTARGRDNYHLYSVLRTKPGRADAPPATCMSCSDKIASWSLLGFQGALASCFFSPPLYVTAIIIGGVPNTMRDIVKEDGSRAWWGRIAGRFQDLPFGYRLVRPNIYFTTATFPYAREYLASRDGSQVITSCNESSCWVADSIKPHDILINGRRRGVPPKHHHTERFQPSLCKVSLFRLFFQTRERLGFPSDSDHATYFETKQSMSQYQSIKEMLMGDGAPFSGWIRGGRQWQSFDVMGRHQGS